MVAAEIFLHLPLEAEIRVDAVVQRGVMKDHVPKCGRIFAQQLSQVCIDQLDLHSVAYSINH